MQGLGFRVWGLGFRVQGLGFRGLGFQDVGFPRLKDSGVEESRLQGFEVRGLGGAYYGQDLLPTYKNQFWAWGC